jgi:hypothetical protein
LLKPSRYSVNSSTTQAADARLIRRWMIAPADVCQMSFNNGRSLEQGCLHWPRLWCLIARWPGFLAGIASRW